MREPFSSARTYITLLLALEVCLGVGIVIATGIYQYILGSYMDEMERRMLSGQLFNTYILGFQVIVTYLASIAIWKRLWSRAYSSNVQYIIRVWMSFCFLIVFCGFGTIWSLFTCADATIQSAENSLLKGIDMYYTCPEWKLLWDGLQYHKECCGVHNYKDWMKASWMPQNTTVDKCNSNGGNDRQATLAPYACCKHDCTACYQNYVPRTGSNDGGGGVPSLNLNQLNKDGCLPIFTHNLFCLLYILIALVVILFKLDLIICGLARYVMRVQRRPGCAEQSNKGCTDDDGRSIILVKCPPNVRCIVDPDDEIPSQENICCSQSELQQFYTVKQEITNMPSERLMQTHVCGCSAKANPSRLMQLHVCRGNLPVQMQMQWHVCRGNLRS